MKNKIEDLRNHLFETLERLKDDESPMDIDRALAIAEVGKVIVDSAKVECLFLKATRKKEGTGLMEESQAAKFINTEEPKKLERPAAEYNFKGDTHDSVSKRYANEENK